MHQYMNHGGKYFNFISLNESFLFILGSVTNYRVARPPCNSLQEPNINTEPNTVYLLNLIPFIIINGTARIIILRLGTGLWLRLTDCSQKK